MKGRMANQSKMTLNARFSSLRGGKARGGNRQQQIAQASRKNKRLVQQMENRPAVKAALKNKQRGAARGVLRGARGSTRGGAVRVGSMIKKFDRPVTGTPQDSLQKPASRGARGGRGNLRGGLQKFNRPVTGTPQSALNKPAVKSTPAKPRGGNFVKRGNNQRAANKPRPAAVAMRGANARGNIRGTRGRGRGSNNSTKPVISVKSRLSIKGRLSQPVNSAAGGRLGFQTASRGGFRGASRGRANFNRGGGSFGQRTGRGGRGGFSSQW